jgi:indole-3-glycerol phosphate synthase
VAYDGSVLETILSSVRARLGEVRARRDEWREAALAAPPARGFAAALRTAGLSVIAEVKRRSPSAGVLAADLDVAERAAAYQEGGAAAVSVLTEPDHFAGSPGDLVAVRLAADLLVLRKDFVIDPAQVWQSRALGADAVLLIAAILDDRGLSELLGAAAAAGLDALVEVHDEREAERAVALGAGLIGVNNRDLGTFRVDLATAERLRPLLPDDAVAVAESGVSGASAAARMAAAGFDAILVGEALVRAEDPAALVAALRGVGS